jgi:sulfotransferase
MKSFNVVCGLPRSGSTLMCNILNQNPDLHASSTSVLPSVMMAMSNLYSNSPEVMSLLTMEREKTEKRIVRSMQAVISAWYAEEDKHVFDKGRGWAANSLLLKQLYPASLIICMVRDPRNVFASLEKHHRKNPALDYIANPQEKGLYARADAFFSPNGMIGSCILGIEDLVRRKPGNLLVIPYEEMVKNPQVVMDVVYEKMKVASFKHDFDKVENTSQDVDSLYLNKFEHRGDGSVKPSNPDEWTQYVPDDLASLIMNRYPFFNQAFGYSTPIKMRWNS